MLCRTHGANDELVCTVAGARLQPLGLAIVQEGAETAAVEVVEDSDEEFLVKLEGAREMVPQLPHTVDELDKDRGPLLVRVVAVAMPDPLPELVPKR